MRVLEQSVNLRWQKPKFTKKKKKRYREHDLSFLRPSHAGLCAAVSVIQVLSAVSNYSEDGLQGQPVVFTGAGLKINIKSMQFHFSSLQHIYTLRAQTEEAEEVCPWYLCQPGGNASRKLCWTLSLICMWPRRRPKMWEDSGCPSDDTAGCCSVTPSTERTPGENPPSHVYEPSLNTS